MSIRERVAAMPAFKSGKRCPSCDDALIRHTLHGSRSKPSLPRHHAISRDPVSISECSGCPGELPPYVSETGINSVILHSCICFRLVYPIIPWWSPVYSCFPAFVTHFVLMLVEIYKIALPQLCWRVCMIISSVRLLHGWPNSL